MEIPVLIVNVSEVVVVVHSPHNGPQMAVWAIAQVPGGRLEIKYCSLSATMSAPQPTQ